MIETEDISFIIEQIGNNFGVVSLSEEMLNGN